MPSPGGSSCGEQRPVTGDQHQVVIGDRDGRGEVDGIVCPQRLRLGELGGPVDQIGVDIDEVELGRQVVECVDGGSELSGGQALLPRGRKAWSREGAIDREPWRPRCATTAWCAPYDSAA